MPLILSVIMMDKVKVVFRKCVEFEIIPYSPRVIGGGRSMTSLEPFKVGIRMYTEREIPVTVTPRDYCLKEEAFVRDLPDQSAGRVSVATFRANPTDSGFLDLTYLKEEGWKLYDFESYTIPFQNLKEASS